MTRTDNINLKIKELERAVQKLRRDRNILKQELERVKKRTSSRYMA